MPSLAELQDALMNADKAGDTQAATALANELRRLQQPTTPQAPTQAATPAQQPIEKGGLFSRYVEPALTIGSGMIAEPVAGIAGIAQGVNPFAEPGSGAEAVRSTREAMTYQPRTQAGQEGLLAVGETLEPITSRFQELETTLAEKGYEEAGPLGAATLGTLPTAALTMLGGVRGFKPKTVKSSAVNKLLKKSAPTIDELKTTARGLYRELDDSGVVVNPSRLDRLGESIINKATKEGYHPKLHPKVSVALDEFEKIKGQPKSLSEVDTLRKIVRSSAKSLDPDEARIGSMLIDDIDNFLDGLDKAALLKGKKKAGKLGDKFKDARQLWHRAKKSELLEDAFEKAKNQASGFENGIRTQFRSILNSKKKLRGFTPEEVNAMRYVVRGGTAENIAKKIGRFGFGEGQASSMLMSSLGVAGGATLGGAPGAVAVPLIGQVSRNLAQKLTRNNAEMTNLIVRAGNDGKKVVSAYLKAVPKKERSIPELTELLKRPGISLNKLRKQTVKSPNKLVADSVFYADLLQQQELEQ